MLIPSLLVLVVTAASVVEAGPAASQCTTPLKPTANPNDPHWMQTIKRQGSSAYNPNPSTYKVYRNVKDYGAKGDGVTDDTVAINQAISDQNRCGIGCASSTRSPAIIFFPSGTYRVTGSIAPNGASGLHWQVAQATTLVNIVVDMSQDSNTNQAGMWMENGSGGFMSDLVFNGGKVGMSVGNQQFTVRNLKVNNARLGVEMNWNWGWTFQGFDFKNTTVGFQIAQGANSTAAQSAGSEVLLDGDVSDVQTFIKTSTPTTTSLAGSVLIDNVKFTNVGAGYVDGAGVTKLTGGSKTIRQWAEGNKYYGTVTTPTYILDNVNAPAKPSVLLDSSGKIFQRGRTDYADWAPDQFAHVRDSGAKGDGVTDDTKAIKAFIKQYAACKILYFDAGTYMVTDTIEFPSGSIVVGE
ncbi:hypothetical protein FRC00_009248, partial [Tulasnella sp. 408]